MILELLLVVATAPVFIQASEVNLRAGPSKSAVVQDRVRIGDQCVVLKEEGDWIKLRCSGERGGYTLRALVGESKPELADLVARSRAATDPKEGLTLAIRAATLSGDEATTSLVKDKWLLAEHLFAARTRRAEKEWLFLCEGSKRGRQCVEALMRFDGLDLQVDVRGDTFVVHWTDRELLNVVAGTIRGERVQVRRTFRSRAPGVVQRALRGSGLVSEGGARRMLSAAEIRAVRALPEEFAIVDKDGEVLCGPRQGFREFEVPPTGVPWVFTRKRTSVLADDPDTEPVQAIALRRGVLTLDGCTFQSKGARTRMRCDRHVLQPMTLERWGAACEPVQPDGPEDRDELADMNTVPEDAPISICEDQDRESCASTEVAPGRCVWSGDLCDWEN